MYATFKNITQTSTEEIIRLLINIPKRISCLELETEVFLDRKTDLDKIFSAIPRHIVELRLSSPSPSRSTDEIIILLQLIPKHIKNVELGKETLVNRNIDLDKILSAFPPQIDAVTISLNKKLNLEQVYELIPIDPTKNYIQQLPVELQAYISTFFDLKSKAKFSQTNFFYYNMFYNETSVSLDRRLVKMQMTNGAIDLYGEDNRKLTTFVAKMLDVNFEDIQTTERLEEEIFKHALLLNPELAKDPVLFRGKVVDGQAHYGMNYRDLCIQYKTFSSAEVQALVKTYNSYYPECKAFVDRNVRFALDAQVFCKQILPVIAALLDRPSKKVDAQAPGLVTLRC